MASLFSAEALKQIVSTTLADVPKDHKMAVVGTVDKAGIQTVANFSFKEGQWQLKAAYRHDWTGEDSVGASVMFSR